MGRGSLRSGSAQSLVPRQGSAVGPSVARARVAFVCCSPVGLPISRITSLFCVCDLAYAAYYLGRRAAVEWRPREGVRSTAARPCGEGSGLGDRVRRCRREGEGRRKQTAQPLTSSILHCSNKQSSQPECRPSLLLSVSVTLGPSTAPPATFPGCDRRHGIPP